MSESALVIRTGEDILRAFRAPEPQLRAALLRAILEDPAGALACGAHAGKDVVDLLLSEAGMTTPDTKEWYATLQLLSGFRDPRAVDFLFGSLSRCIAPEALSAFVRRLAGEPLGRHCKSLGHLLMQDRSLQHARAAATLLEREEGLVARQQVRVSILTHTAAQPVNEATEKAWLAELRGPFAYEARLTLEQADAASFCRLRSRWNDLRAEDQAWLMAWGAGFHPVHSLEMIDGALEDSDPQVRLAAIEAVGKLGPAASLLQARLARFLESGEPAERLAAVRAGAHCSDWGALLHETEDLELRLACIPRLAEAEGERAVPELIRLLESNEWQTRAAATEALAIIGDAAAEATRPLLKRGSLDTRVAATRTLLMLGRDEWLQQDLLHCAVA